MPLRLQVQELTPPSPLVCLRYNFKTPDVLVGGCYNGLVCVFDVKKPRGIAIQVRSRSCRRCGCTTCWRPVSLPLH
jgi:hypothetical protein